MIVYEHILICVQCRVQYGTVYTKKLEELSKEDVLIAGGKGASLGEMFGYGIPVPDGFIITSDTFDTFLSIANLVPEIETVLQTVDTRLVHTVDSAAEKIQHLILHAPLSKDIEDEIIYAYKTLGAAYVAVRSSATAEDGAEHAWAGQLSSFLNVREDHVLEKVKECWASLFTARAIFYRFEKSLHTKHISVAIVVQKMINAEKSGVAFSVHPITENPNQIIIEAGFGLGEAIVSGEVTPDSYTVNKEKCAIETCVVQIQKKALYRSDKEETGEFCTWHNLDSEKATKQVLSDDEICELAALVSLIEKLYGFPCDIEWAFENGKFYITQSRPITTLGHNIQSHKLQKWEKVWEAGNAPVLEMTHGTMLAYPLQKELGLVDTDMAIVGSREKITAYYEQESLNKSGKDGFEFYLSQKGPQYLKSAEDIIQKADAFVELLEQSKATTELLLETSELLRSVFAYFNLTNPQFVSVLEAETLKELKVYVVDDPESVFRDLCVSEKMSRLQQEQLDWMMLVERARTHEESTKEQIESHYKKYRYLVGDEGNTQVTIASLTALLNRDIKQNVQYGDEMSGMANYTTVARALKQSHVYTYSLSQDLVQKCELLAHIGHIRLELRSAWTALFHVFRAHLQELAQEANVPYELLVQLTIEEVIKYLRQHKRCEERSDVFSLVLHNGEWDLRFGQNAKTRAHFSTPTDFDIKRGLRGSVAFPGVVTGRVVLINWGASDFDEKIRNFPEGGILVAGQTRPMLVPAIKLAEAIITDEGGITSHAAIVAREFKKPCIIGTKTATEIFKDGDLVMVDAQQGAVFLIEE